MKDSVEQGCVLNARTSVCVCVCVCVCARARARARVREHLCVRVRSVVSIVFNVRVCWLVFGDAAAVEAVCCSIIFIYKFTTGHEIKGTQNCHPLNLK